LSFRRRNYVIIASLDQLFYCLVVYHFERQNNCNVAIHAADERIFKKAGES
jgi:hypothetical protein